MSWQVTAAAHAILTIAYLGIAFMIGRGLTNERQWRSNPLAVATFAIFLTCALGHGIHIEHALIGPSFDPEVAAANRITLADPWLIVWTPLTAVAALWYFAKRAQLKALHGGAPLVEDLVRRQQEARLLHDGVMASVDRARRLLRDGDEQAAAAEIANGMQGAEEIITAFLGGAGDGRLRPGDLRRTEQ